MKDHLAYSIVIPIHNEAGNITQLDAEIKAVLPRLGGTSEIIYIDDGSTDGSLEVLKTLRGVTIIELNRNYGQATALDAGFKAAGGAIVISLDGDGQNDPKDIPALLKKLEDEQLDVVAGWRKHRNDKHNILFITVVARILRRIFIGDIVHDSGCTLRVYRAKAVKSLDIGGEMHRFILALLKWKGFKIGEMVVSHRARTNGVSKYGPTKAFRGLIDLVYIWFIHKYSQRPLHLFGYMSFGAFALSAISGFWAIYGKLALGLSLNRNGWFFITFFFLLGGIIFFSFGIVIDLLMQIRFNTSKSEHRYYIRETINT
jgi:glycosyltransferase involved in cell wall biosynthesis